MKIGIMGAMSEEIDTILGLMKDTSEIDYGKRRYYCGKINDLNVVLVFSRWGKVAATTTATSLITRFGVDKIIFTGVAGAISNDLSIGDVVISSELYQHDMDARPLFDKHVIPLTEITFFKADLSLINLAASACNNLFQYSQKQIPVSTLSEFEIYSPKYLIGSIASGDQFIADSQKTATILADQSRTLAVEMEGAAVAQVCYDYQLPFVVIRTISDLANHKSHIDFPKFINQVARYYSENIVSYMLSMINE